MSKLHNSLTVEPNTSKVPETANTSCIIWSIALVLFILIVLGSIIYLFGATFSDMDSVLDNINP